MRIYEDSAGVGGILNLIDLKKPPTAQQTVHSSDHEDSLGVQKGSYIGNGEHGEHDEPSQSLYHLSRFDFHIQKNLEPFFLLRPKRRTRRSTRRLTHRGPEPGRAHAAAVETLGLLREASGSSRNLMQIKGAV